MASINYHTSNSKDGNMSFRYGDKKEILNNRKKFLFKYNIILNNCIVMNMENGTKILNVNTKEKGKGISIKNGVLSDCLITNKKNLYLFLLTGDCLPISIWDTSHKFIALIHISRHNAGEKFITKIINKIKSDFNCPPHNLIVTIGPHIQKQSYLLEKMIIKSPKEWKPFLKKYDLDKIYIDLQGFISQQLVNEGIVKKNIKISKINTATSLKYFSHYRSIKLNEPEKRFATVIGLKK